MKAIITNITRHPGFGGTVREYDYVVLNTIAGPVEIPKHDFHFNVEIGKQVWLQYVAVGNGSRWFPRECESS